MSETNFVFEQSCLTEVDQSHGRVAWEPSDSDWGKYKETILELFQKNTLQEMMAEMEQCYGFTASRDQYTRHIYKKWAIVTKYNKKNDMFVMARILTEREQRGRDTHFEYHGQTIGKAEIQRYFRRKKISIAQAAEKGREYPTLRRATVPISIPPPDKQSHLELLFWHVAKYGSNTPFPCYDQSRFTVDFFEYHERHGIIRKLVNEGISLMDVESRHRFIAGASCIIRTLCHLFPPGHNLLAIFRKCLVHIYESCTCITEDSKPVSRNLVGYLLNKAPKVHLGVAEIMLRLPGCESQDINKLFDAINDILWESHRASEGCGSMEKVAYSFGCRDRTASDAAPIVEYCGNCVHKLFGELYPAVEEDPESIPEICLELLKPQVLNSLKPFQIVIVLDAFTTWTDSHCYCNKDLLMELAEVCTRRYLYQVYKTEFGKYDIQTLHQEHMIDIMGFKCIGDIPLTTVQCTTTFAPGVRALWCAILEGKDVGEFLIESRDVCAPLLSMAKMYLKWVGHRHLVP